MFVWATGTACRNLAFSSPSPPSLTLNGHLAAYDSGRCCRTYIVTSLGIATGNQGRRCNGVQRAALVRRDGVPVAGRTVVPLCHRLATRALDPLREADTRESSSFPPSPGQMKFNINMGFAR